MTDVARISVDEARAKAMSGAAVLVCAYDDAEKCSKMKLEGAITLAGLRASLASLPKDKELIFYCA
jgi:rhodanese-related sulfurtransferase